MRYFKSVSLTVLLMTLLALPAMARPGGGGYRGGGYYGGGARHHGGGYYPRYYGGSRWSFGIGFPLIIPMPYYGGSYYGSPPVVVGREVGRGSITADAQRVLSQRGYYRGAIDGIIGPQTRAAIRAWQADVGLPVTGNLDARTIRSLALV